MKNRGAGLPAVGKEVMPKGAQHPVTARSGATENIPRTVAEMRRAIHLTTCFLTLTWRLFLPPFSF